MKINKDKLYTTREVAGMFGKNKQAINRSCRQGTIKCVKVFSEWRIKGNVLDELINPVEDDS